MAGQLAAAQTQINDAKDLIASNLAQINSQIVTMATSVATMEQTLQQQPMKSCIAS